MAQQLGWIELLNRSSSYEIIQKQKFYNIWKESRIKASLVWVINIRDHKIEKLIYLSFGIQNSVWMASLNVYIKALAALAILEDYHYPHLAVYNCMWLQLA